MGWREAVQHVYAKAVKSNDLHLSPFPVNLSEVRLYRLKWIVADNQWCEYVASESKLWNRHFDPLCGSCQLFVAILLLKVPEYQSKKVSINPLWKQTEFLHRKLTTRYPLGCRWDWPDKICKQRSRNQKIGLPMPLFFKTGKPKFPPYFVRWDGWPDKIASSGHDSSLVSEYRWLLQMNH